jgi:hypothetical protein
MDHNKQNIYRRIETLFACKNGEQLFASMVTMQLEISPEILQETAESFVIYGIIKEFDDRKLDALWYAHLTKIFYEKTNNAA